jgi:hypothetical protein
LAKAKPEALLAEFVAGLQDLGWKDNQNLHIEVRKSAGDPNAHVLRRFELVD